MLMSLKRWVFGSKIHKRTPNYYIRLLYYAVLYYIAIQAVSKLVYSLKMREPTGMQQLPNSAATCESCERNVSRHTSPMAIPNVRLNEQCKVSKSPTLTVRPVHGPSNQSDCNTPIEECVTDASGFSMFARFNRFLNGYTSYPRNNYELTTADATPPLDLEEYQYIQSRNASH